MNLILEPKGDFAVTAVELSADNPREHIGANNPPEETPFEKIKKKIEDLYDEAKQWLDGAPVTTKPVADGISNLANMILAAQQEADKLRKEENESFDKGKAEVQARYNLLIGDTTKIKGKTVLAREACKKALEPYLKAEAARIAAEEAEAQRLADEAALAAREVLTFADRSNLAEREIVEEVLQVAKIAERVATKVGNQTAVASGGVGRGIGLRTVYVTTLTDYAAATAHYYTKYPEELKGVLWDMAKSDVARGVREIPGFTITEEKKVA